MKKESPNVAKNKVELQVEGMTCQGCVRSIESKLSTVPGVGYAHVNLGAGKVVVEFDDAQTAVNDLMGAVEQIGFHASRA